MSMREVVDGTTQQNEELEAMRKEERARVRGLEHELAFMNAIFNATHKQGKANRSSVETWARNWKKKNPRHPRCAKKAESKLVTAAEAHWDKTREEQTAHIKVVREKRDTRKKLLTRWDKEKRRTVGITSFTSGAIRAETTAVLSVRTHQRQHADARHILKQRKMVAKDVAQTMMDQKCNARDGTLEEDPSQGVTWIYKTRVSKRTRKTRKTR